MIFFGHVALTTGAVLVIDKSLAKIKSSAGKKSTDPSIIEAESGKHHIDYRLVVIGSMLPDIIDKPVGTFFFNNVFSNGRIFSHTVLFFLVLAIPAVILYWRRRSIWLSILAFGSLMHIILDEMWRTPHTLFWPLFGLSFERVPTETWVLNIIQKIPSIPMYWIPEVIGIVIVVILFIRQVKAGKVMEFITKGTLV